MAIGIEALIDKVTSHASRLGCFATVQGYEPKSMPGNEPGSDLTYAVFLSALGASRTGSGLSSTTARVELTGQIYKPFMSQPEHHLEPAIAHACDLLFEAYTGDFDLGGAARNIDVLGAQGQGLQARAGYQNIDGATFRTLNIIIPIIVNDAWIQEA